MKRLERQRGLMESHLWEEVNGVFSDAVSVEKRFIEQLCVGRTSFVCSLNVAILC